LLREDLRNPVLRERGARWLATLYTAIERRLADTDTDTSPASGLGPLVVAQWQGTLTIWGFTRQASLDELVGTMLRDLLRRVATPTPTQQEVP
jgi:hypothetical protein